ncbi:MAG: transposase [Candidatus Parcubacteria bacterium]|nr:transposase [Candidatus Parcubacteria bacterium]
MHKGAQKRIYFEGATYFVTGVADNRVEYFKESIFCELFIEILKLAKKRHKFDLYSFVILLDHFHLMFLPYEAMDLSKIMQFIKRHYTRNINFILGYVDEGAICKSLLQLGEEYKIYEEIIEKHYEYLITTRRQFVAKYGLNQTLYVKFHWQKSLHDHYIRNYDDFNQHMRYLYNNPAKHNIFDAANYQYIYTKYPGLIDEI